MKAGRLGVAVGLCLFIGSSVAAQTAPDVERGLTIARTHCAQCHSIDNADASPSPHPGAPPLRDLHTRYPVENLEEALAEGIVTGHPAMPPFHFEPDQIASLIAFLKSLE
ncbi:MAG: cytochrome c [Sphingomonadaceae bacterium]